MTDQPPIEEPGLRLPWEVSAAVTGCVGLIFSMTFAGSVARWTTPGKPSVGLLLLGIAAVQGVMAGAVFLVAWRRLRPGWRLLGMGLGEPRLSDVLIGLAAGPVFLLAVAALSILSVPILQRFGIQPQADPFLRLIHGASPRHLPVLLFGALIAAPFAEELFFRQVVFRACRRYVGGVVAALIASLVFATLHGRAVAIPALMVLGLLLQYLRDRRGTVWAAVFAHAGFNATAITLASLLPASPVS